jgi:hypothetical protein
MNQDKSLRWLICLSLFQYRFYNNNVSIWPAEAASAILVQVSKSLISQPRADFPPDCPDGTLKQCISQIQSNSG